MENPRIWFRSISLENVRSFGQKQTIYFTEDGTENGATARWNVILGDNGTGKTTVLKGLCLMGLKFTAERQIDFFSKNYYKGSLRGTAERKNGEVLDLTGNVEFDFTRLGPNVRYSNAVNNYYRIGSEMKLFAYGASRRSAKTPFSQEKVGSDSVSSLFDEDAFLINPESWLLEAELSSLKNAEDKVTSDYYELVLSALKRLFKDEIHDIKSHKVQYSTRVYFGTHYGSVLLHDLSLGYKTLIAWMVDFAKGLFDQYPDSKSPLSEPAVCLVDEIDLHLHPKFQRNIIAFLTETFPNTQFIVTAHSPLVVQAAEDFNANLIVLKREGNETMVTSGLEVRNWRIDQILASDLFEEIPSRSPQAEEQMQRRRELLLKDERSEQDNKELTQLEQELGILSSSESWESVKAMDIIKRAILNQE